MQRIHLFRLFALVTILSLLLGGPLPALQAQEGAAGHPELVGALWDEHEQLVKEGVLEKRRTRLGPKVRTGLIAGGAVLAVGVAIAVILVSSLRRETVVLTVSP